MDIIWGNRAGKIKIQKKFNFHETISKMETTNSLCMKYICEIFKMFRNKLKNLHYSFTHLHQQRKLKKITTPRLSNFAEQFFYLIHFDLFCTFGINIQNNSGIKGK